MANFLVDHEYTLDITPSARPQLVHVSEYDVGRRFTFTITKDGEEMQNLTSALGAVTVEGTIGSYAFSESASIENGKIVFQLTESMTAHAGKAWTKIKFANADAPISTCAFFLVVDRAGVEAGTVIGAPGFQEQINEGVAEYFDNDPPFFELPSGGQSGQALLSDGADGTYWGQVQGGGSGLTEAIKTALMNVANHIGTWTDAHGVEYAQALHDALYPSAPPANLVSISAAFNQGSAVIYDTDDLDTLRQYLTVTATYDDTSTGVVTNYTLSGTLTVGTSTITVSYGGKTTTFNVTVSSGNTIDGTSVTWVSGYVNTSGAVVPSGSAGTYTSDYVNSSGKSHVVLALDGASDLRFAFYDSSKAFISRVLSATADIPTNAAYLRATITKSSLGNSGYDGTGTTITFS